MRNAMETELLKQEEWATEPRRDAELNETARNTTPRAKVTETARPVPHTHTARLQRPLARLATVDFLSTRLHQILALAHGSEGFRAVLLSFLLDLILGQCARYLIERYKASIAQHIPHLLEEVYCFQAVDSSLRWLNDWPVGLKLNTPLSEFYCQTLGSIVRGWERLFVPLITEHVDLVLAIVSGSSYLGLGLSLSIIIDLISFLTLHLRLSWMATNAICLWQLGSLSGLWNLFRGKRWNVLRKRTDSYAYDVDQLFLGTLLFTVSIFLLPTVMVYASLFGAIHLLVSSLCWILQSLVRALNGSAFNPT